MRTRQWVILGILAVLTLPACFQSLSVEPSQCKNILAKGSLIHVGPRDYRYSTENFANYVTDSRGNLAGWIYSTQETKEEFYQPNGNAALQRVRPANERIGTTFDDESAFLKKRSLQPDNLTACGFPTEEKSGGFTFGGSKCRGSSQPGAKLTADGHTMQVKFITPVTDIHDKVKGWLYSSDPKRRYVFISSANAPSVLIPEEAIPGTTLLHTDTLAFVKQRFGHDATETNCQNDSL